MLVPSVEYQKLYIEKINAMSSIEQLEELTILSLEFKDIYGEYTYEISTKYKEWKYDYLLKHLSNKLDGVE